MLEQMGKPGASLPLIARSDVVGDADGDDRSGMIYRENHTQSISKPVIGKFDLGQPRCRGRLVCQTGASGTDRKSQGISGCNSDLSVIHIHLSLFTYKSGMAWH